MTLDCSALSEQQLIDLLSENYRLAAESCDKLAGGLRGRIYLRLREQLKIIEDCCRHLGANHRADARWLQNGLQAAEAHRRSGDWLRAKQPSWRFKGLAEILRRGQIAAKNLATKRTGRSGIILPKEQPAPHRENRPVQIILPEGYKTH